jgi:dihydroorotase
MQTLKIRKMDDMHVHLRQGQMLANVVEHTALQCGRALVMPNTLPAILTADDVVAYRKSIVQHVPKGVNFEPLMTFKVTASTKPEDIVELKSAGAVAGKLYPEGVTTNSADGVRDLKELYAVYSAMQDAGLVLCLHGEKPGVFSLDRESAFLETLQQLVADFPKLRIVLEHATTKEAVELVAALPSTVSATLTVHHLFITLDDVIGDKLNPHLFCKPIAKRESDRLALVNAAISGNPKFFLGTDSAPHAIESKECACGAAGVYSAPVVLPALAQLFEKHSALNKLESFVSEFGSRFYGLSLNKEFLLLEKHKWTVPSEYGGVVPFMAGQELSWAIQQSRHSENHSNTTESEQAAIR